MATIKLANNAKSTLLYGITNVAVTLYVQAGDGAKFPTLAAGDWFYATLVASGGATVEIVKCTARSSDTLTIARAQDSTAAAAFSAGDKVELRWCRQAALDMITTTGGAATTDQVQTGSLLYALATGTDTYAATLAPALTVYTQGQVIHIKIPNANTVAAPTLNVNAVGAKKIFKGGGSALAVGDMAAVGHYDFSYDTTLDTAAGGWLLLNPEAAADSGGIGSAIINNTATVASPLVLTSATHNTHIIRTTATATERVFTFPDAAANSGMYFWIDNASANDGSPGASGLRLLSNGGTIGDAAAAGTTNYIPAYTVIGFQSDGTNWIVFQYSGKTTFQWSAAGTLYIPPGVRNILISAVGSGAGGSAQGGAGSVGGATSVGALLSVNGGTIAAEPSYSGTGVIVRGGAKGSFNEGFPGEQNETSINDNQHGGDSPFGRGGLVYNTSARVAPSGYGAGGHGADGYNPGGGGAWAMRVPVAVTPGTSHAITAPAGGAAGPQGSSAFAPTAGTSGFVLVELN